MQGGYTITAISTSRGKGVITARRICITIPCVTVASYLGGFRCRYWQHLKREQMLYTITSRTREWHAMRIGASCCQCLTLP